MKHPRQSAFSHLAIVTTLSLIANGISQAQTVRVVNMIPQTRSGETHQDSEPNIAVNPSNVNQIAGSVSTSSSGGCGPETDPIFVSSDGGNHWALNCILPSHRAGDAPPHITLSFGRTGNRLYASDVFGVFGDTYVLRTRNFLGPERMDSLIHRIGAPHVVRPYLEAITIAGNDRIYIGFSEVSESPFRTAHIMYFLNAEAAPPVVFGFPPEGVHRASLIQTRDLPRSLVTSGLDHVTVRPAIAPDGTVYVVFYGPRSASCTVAKPICTEILADIVVVRDDTGGTGADAFTHLREPALPDGDGLSGRVVVSRRNVPMESFPHPDFGQERLAQTHLAIAVDPANSSNVYVAWADRVGSEFNTLHVRRSQDRGLTWSGADLRTITNAINPALAINSAGIVGFLYQKHEGKGSGQRWITRLELANRDFRSLGDFTLANTPANTPSFRTLPYLGDYIDLMAVGHNFYGVFSANNTPDLTNFPNSVTYQRNADFTTHTLLDMDETTPVIVSIDPFFFAVEDVSLDPCFVSPWLCTEPVRSGKEFVEIECLFRGCFVVDRLPRNCQVKWDCPGCGRRGLCPPYYNIFLEGLGAAWIVGLVDSKGRPAPHELFKTRNGVVISFRPSKEKFSPGLIGDYMLVFQMSQKGKVGTKYRVKARLETSDRSYAQR